MTNLLIFSSFLLFSYSFHSPSFSLFQPTWNHLATIIWLSKQWRSLRKSTFVKLFVVSTQMHLWVRIFDEIVSGKILAKDSSEMIYSNFTSKMQSLYSNSHCASQSAAAIRSELLFRSTQCLFSHSFSSYFLFLAKFWMIVRSQFLFK